jgi:hypothetical protein
MSKCFYGVEFLREYDPHDQEHIDRNHRLCELPSGPKLLQDAFDCILSRVKGLHTFAMRFLAYPHLFLERQSKRVDRVHSQVLHRDQQFEDSKGF